MIYFVTTNKHKVEQARHVFSSFGLTLKWLKISYDESSDDTIEQVAQKSAKKLSTKLQKTVIVEDTGLFFKAYPGFPGSMPKFVYTTLGYTGLFRLLKGTSKEATFRSCIAICSPGKKARFFTGEMRGKITDKIRCPKKDVLPYDRIFIPAGYKKPICTLSIDEKKNISHRLKAFQLLAAHLKKKKKL